MLKYAIFVVIAIVAVGEFASRHIVVEVQKNLGNCIAVSTR